MKQCTNCRRQFQNTQIVCPDCHTELIQIPDNSDNLFLTHTDPVQISGNTNVAAPQLPHLRFSEQLTEGPSTAEAVRQMYYSQIPAQPARQPRTRRTAQRRENPVQEARTAPQPRTVPRPVHAPDRPAYSFLGARQQGTAQRTGEAPQTPDAQQPPDTPQEPQNPAGNLVADARHRSFFNGGAPIAERTEGASPRENLLMRRLTAGRQRPQGVRNGEDRRRTPFRGGAAGINGASAARYLRIAIPALLLIAATAAVIANWSVISALLGQILLIWIVSFGLTLWIARRFLNFESVLGISCVLTLIGMLILHNVLDVRNGIAGLFSAVMPCLIIFAGILYIFRSVFRRS